MFCVAGMLARSEVRSARAQSATSREVSLSAKPAPDAFSEHLRRRCARLGWTGLSSTLQLMVYDPLDDLAACAPPSPTLPLGSRRATQQWALVLRAITARQTRRLARLLKPYQLLADAQVKLRSESLNTPESSDGSEGGALEDSTWTPWRELAPEYHRYGWLSAEHLKGDERLIFKWTLPTLPRGGQIALGYRGRVKVRWGGEVVANLPRKERLWIDQSIHTLEATQTSQELTLELSAGAQAVVRWSRARSAQTLWGRGLSRLKRDPNQLDPLALISLGLYAYLAQVPDSERMLPILEADTRWSREPTLDLALVFWALSPPAVRGQIWSDYRLEHAYTQALNRRDHSRVSALSKHSSELLYHELLLKRLYSNLTHDRLYEVARDLEVARQRPTLPVKTRLAESEVAQRLGMNHHALSLLKSGGDDPRLWLARLQLLDSLGDTINEQHIRSILNQANPELLRTSGLTSVTSQLVLKALTYAMKLSSSSRETLERKTRGEVARNGGETENLKDREWMRIWTPAASLLQHGPQSFSLWRVLALELLEGSHSTSAQWMSETLLDSAPIRAGHIYEALKHRSEIQVDAPRNQVSETSAETRAAPSTTPLGGPDLLSRIMESQPSHLDDPNSVSGDLRLSPVESVAATSLYHHVHYHLVKGRLTRTVRRVLQPHTRTGAQKLLKLSIAHSPERQRFKIDHAVHLRGAHTDEEQRLSPPSLTRRELSRPEDRLFYDLVAEELNFEDVRPQDVIDLQWSVAEQSVDYDHERLHADLLVLAGPLPRQCVLVTMGPKADQMLDVAIDLKSYRQTSCLNLDTDPSELSETRDGQSSVMRTSQTPQRAQNDQSAREIRKLVSLTEVRPLKYVAYGPRGTSQTPYVHLSNLRNWSSLRELYHAMLKPLVQPHEIIRETARRWTRAIKPWSRDPRDRPRFEREVIEALYREVTSRVRYVGLEFGLHSYFPAPPHQTLTRNSGDCKDRAALMMSLAATLGISLDFVMVRTAHAGALKNHEIASLSTFDHAIIYSPTLKRYLDPTVSASDPWVLPLADQGGQALHVPNPLFEETLDTLAANRLLRIPHSTAESQGESWHLAISTGAEGDPVVRVRGELRGSFAAQVRRSLLAHEHPQQWSTLREQLNTVQMYFDPQLKPSTLQVRLDQRDPLEVIGEFNEPSQMAQLKLPSFDLTRRFALNTSTRTAKLLLPSFHQEQCLKDERASSGLHANLQKHMAQIQAELDRLPPSPRSEITTSLSVNEGWICARLSLSAHVVSPQEYPHHRAWLSEAEHLLDLNRFLTLPSE